MATSSVRLAMLEHLGIFPVDQPIYASAFFLHMRNVALQLLILIGDTCDQGIGSIGSSLNDIRDFVNAQPATTRVDGDQWNRPGSRPNSYCGITR